MNLPRNSKNYGKSDDLCACSQSLSHRSKPILKQGIMWWSPQKSSRAWQSSRALYELSNSMNANHAFN